MKTPLLVINNYQNHIGLRFTHIACRVGGGQATVTFAPEINSGCVFEAEHFKGSGQVGSGGRGSRLRELASCDCIDTG